MRGAAGEQYEGVGSSVAGPSSERQSIAGGWGGKVVDEG